MPDNPLHPDREELAAWQAGALADPDRGRTEAHLAGCAECAGTVAAVERGRAALAALAEPELPPGLHERLAAAVAREPVRLDGRRARGRRARRRSQRIAALSAAAAVIVLVAGLVPLLLHAVGQTRGAPGAAGGGLAASSPPATAPSEAAQLPVFQASGSYSASRLRASLTGNPAVRSAYLRAITGTGALSGAPTPPEANRDLHSDDVERPSGRASPGTGSRLTGGLQKSVCVAAAQERAGTTPLRPAFFVNSVYRGRAATVLVTVRADAPDQAELWAFPRGDCSQPPFAHDRVAVSPP